MPPFAVRSLAGSVATVAVLALAAPAAAAPHAPATGRTERNIATTSCPTATGGVHFSAPGSGRTVALTFDDGPGRDTGRIMAILAAAHVTATFFNLGDNEGQRASTVRSEQQAGYPIGDHTWDHADLTGLSASGQASEIDREANEQQAITGTRPCLFRPPYGDYDATTLALARQRHMQVWYWSVDPEDWKADGSGAAYWINRIRSRAEAGASQTHPVILFHNQPIGNPATVAALPSIIRFYKARGYRFVDAFGHTGPPKTTGVSVRSERTAGGQLISITGSELTGVTGVRFGSASGTGLRVASASRLYVRTPKHGAGPVDIRLVSDHGTSAATPSDRFTFVAPPSVSSLQPASGPTAGGTVVRVNGHNFVGVRSVGFGSHTATAVHVVSSDLLYATTPAQGAGAVAVKVTTAYGISPTTSAGSFRYVAPPASTSLSPSSVATAGGTRVTIAGTNLIAPVTVSVDGSGATVDSTTTGSVVFTAPAHAPGAAPVVVADAYGRASALTLTYVAAPVVTSTDPDTLPTAGGVPLTIIGTDLAPSGTVTVDGVPVDVVSSSSTQLVVTAPAHAAGPATLVVTTPFGSSAPTVLTYADPSGP